MRQKDITYHEEWERLSTSLLWDSLDDPKKLTAMLKSCFYAGYRQAETDICTHLNAKGTLAVRNGSGRAVLQYHGEEVPIVDPSKFDAEMARLSGLGAAN